MKLIYMYLKRYETESGVMIAVCDTDLLGKTFREGSLSLEVSKTFYGGKVVSDEEVITELCGASIANLVGEKAISCGIESGFIDGGCVLRIDGVPHAQMLRM